MVFCYSSQNYKDTIPHRGTSRYKDTEVREREMWQDKPQTEEKHLQENRIKYGL